MSDEASSLDVLDINKLMSMLPHRYPFLLVDRIVGVRGDDFGIGIKNVSANEPQFTGHFPGRPIMPGVLMIEGMAQTAGALCLNAGAKGSLVYFMAIDNAKFRRPVVPGDVVEYHMTKLRQRGSVWKYKGEAKVQGTLVAEAELTAMIVE
jgi:3-hydroxyacyl-[acyl-carrier-protein] dehydratase